MMSKVDWSKAPEGATHYGKYETFTSDNFFKLCDYRLYFWQGDGWRIYTYPQNWEFTKIILQNLEERPQEWPEEARIDVIATNGGDGAHYEQQEATQGDKHDQGKPMYNLLPPSAVNAMAEVLTYGANKYAPNNWQRVPDAVERYKAALLRHAFAHLSGEKNDHESGLPHMAHVMCCAAFLIELERNKSDR